LFSYSTKNQNLYSF